MSVAILWRVLPWVGFVLLNLASVSLLSASSLRARSRPAPVASQWAVRLPHGFGLGRAWRRYVHAVLELRQARPDQARRLVPVGWGGARVAPHLSGDRSAAATSERRVRAAEMLLDRALRRARQSELEPLLHRRAWHAAIRLWVARGYAW